MLLSSSPHIVSPVTTRHLMRNMLIALAPVTIFGIVLFGLPALLNIIVSVAAAAGAEWAFRRLIKQDIRIKDCSAFVTGLLLALIIPPSTPWWMTALGAIFAIVVAKEFFGGLGANVFNPALIGRAFLIMSFPVALTTWHKPVGFAPLNDAVTTATPLNLIRQGGTLTELGTSIGITSTEAYSSPDYIGIIRSLFLGATSGSIGETSILLIIAGALFLLLTKTITWHTPAAFIVTAFIMSFALGMDPLISILSGGLIFGAVFMATDYVSAPLTTKGKLLFGLGAGIITVLIRKWGAFPEGVTYSILIMNAATPFLNRLLPQKYGHVKR
ncbi:MAG: RnfABCDGE type electron transport complex subunit D [Spirochaetaceae bacterium]|jgi:electron transport complex protein RnfD|nr:RnfABCDGE type electron transport complex subunit D [Spirochaetaceae bacterium]